MMYAKIGSSPTGSGKNNFFNFFNLLLRLFAFKVYHNMKNFVKTRSYHLVPRVSQKIPKNSFHKKPDANFDSL